VAWEHPENSYNVVACNVSKGGMCIDSCPKISHDINLYIKSSNPVQDRDGNHTHEAFIAKVRWSKRKNNYHGFNIGIEHITQSYFMDRVNDYCTNLFCDMCGSPIEAGLHRTQEDLHLCTDCFWSIGSLDKSITQSSITRFASGNVL
jgi:hypothetical protein